MSREKEETKPSKAEDTKVELEKKIIILEAEKDKISALFGQQIKILEERVQEAEKKEKDAALSKSKMLKVLENWKGDEKTINDKISSLQAQYELALNEIKLQHEDEVNALKRQIEEAKSEHEFKLASKETQDANSSREATSQATKVRELELKVTQLEQENCRLNSENLMLTTRSSQMAGDSSRDMYRREMSRFKEDNKELTRLIQKEYGLNITSIVSDYERKLNDLRNKLLLVVQGCPSCSSKVVSGIDSFDMLSLRDLASKTSKLTTSYSGLPNTEDSSREINTLRNEVNDLRSSLLICEKKLAASSQSTGRHSTQEHPNQRGLTRRTDAQLDNESDYADNLPMAARRSPHVQHHQHATLETLGDSYDYGYPHQSSEVAQGRNDSDRMREDHHQYGDYQALRQSRAGQTVIRSGHKGFMNETPMRSRPPLHSKNELINRSGVRIIDSATKEEGETQMRNSQMYGILKSYPQTRASAQRNYGFDENEGGDVSPYGFRNMKAKNPAYPVGSSISVSKYPSEHYDIDDSDSIMQSGYQRGNHRVHEMVEEHDSIPDLHQHVSMLIDRVSRNEHQHQKDDSFLTSTPSRVHQASGNKKASFNDKGFLNFYRENWHSSTFSLEQD